MTIRDIPIREKIICICHGYLIVGEKYRVVREDDENVFVYAKGKSRRGYRMSIEKFNSNFEIIPPKDKTEEWHKRIRRAIKAIEKSGLWIEEKPYLENLLKMTWEDRKAIIECQDEIYDLRFKKADTVEAVNNIWNRYYSKYPFIGWFTDEGKFQVDFDYICERGAVRLKSMNFGRNNRYYKDQIKQALEDKRNYSTGRVIVSYDNSFVYDAEKGKAWYSEEYRDCGNGHYYLALSENVAWFCEDD